MKANLLSNLSLRSASQKPTTSQTDFVDECLARSGTLRLVHIHAAHATLTHAAAAATRGLRVFAGGAVGSRGEGGVLGGQVILAAGGALHGFGFRASAY